MTDSPQPGSPPSPQSPNGHDADFGFWRNVRRGAWTFSFFFALDLLFWFTADFRTFAPPSDGPFKERISYALLTSAGFFAPLVGSARSFDLALLIAIIGTLCPLAVCGYAGRGCFSSGARVAGFGIWFFFGLVLASLRIT